MSFALNRHLTLLHGLEQCTLRFRGGAVDLVGEHQLGEDWAVMEAEPAFAWLIYGYANDVGWQQVAGELDTMEVQAESPCQRMGQRRFAHAGLIFDQQVTAGKEAGKRKTNDV